MGLFDAMPDPIPTDLEESPPVFTAEQVGAAISAAIDAHTAGEDPQAAAVAALS